MTTAIVSIIHVATMTTLQRIVYALAPWPGTDRVISGQNAGNDVDYAFLSGLSLSLSDDVGEQLIRKGSSFAHRYLKCGHLTNPARVTNKKPTNILGKSPLPISLPFTYYRFVQFIRFLKSYPAAIPFMQ